MPDRLFDALEKAFDAPREEREKILRDALADAPELLAEALDVLRHADDELQIPPPPTGDFTGYMVGPYPLIGMIGEGGMGTVYISKQESTDREIAVKLLLTPAGGKSVTAKRQRREIISSARLAHENIVRVFDAGYDEALGAYYLAMELIRGGRTLRSRRYTPEEAAETIAAVCDGLQHAHDQGIVHRDVKPANILLTLEDVPKLTDFGLAQDSRFILDRLTKTGELAGTPHYMSPEQVARRSNPVDHRTDIYSTGAVLYELLENAPPHDGQTSLEVFAKIREEEPRKLNKRVPRDLATICFKALRKDSSERYQTAREMADDLRRFLAGDAILARPEPLGKRLVRKVKRRRVVTATLVLTAAFVPVLLTVDRKHREQSQLQFMEMERRSIEQMDAQTEKWLLLIPDVPIYHDSEDESDEEKR